jgi:DNA-binding CsgD family transcriptional regulator
MLDQVPVVALTAAVGSAYEIVAVGGAAFAALAAVPAFGTCTLALHAPDGRPVLTVDASTQCSDVEREAFLEHAWATDPLLTALLACHVSQADEQTLLVPLVEPSGLVGTLRCELLTACTRADERLATAVAMVVGARLQQLGVSAATLASADLLTRRQRDTANLALRGMTTDQIAAELAISRNTVKKHLHEVFDRLAVSNRVQLARALQLTQATSDVPVGITRTGDLVVARRSIATAPVAGGTRRNGARGNSDTVLSGAAG